MATSSSLSSEGGACRRGAASGPGPGWNRRGPARPRPGVCLHLPAADRGVKTRALPSPSPHRGPACARVAVRLPCDTQALSWLQWQPPQGSQWILGHTPRPCEDPSKTQTPVSADLFLPDAPGLVPSSALHFRGLAGHESPSHHHLVYVPLPP